MWAMFHILIVFSCIFSLSIAWFCMMFCLSRATVDRAVGALFNKYRCGRFCGMAHGQESTSHHSNEPNKTNQICYPFFTVSTTTWRLSLSIHDSSYLRLSPFCHNLLKQADLNHSPCMINLPSVSLCPCKTKLMSPMLSNHLYRPDRSRKKNGPGPSF